MNQRLKIIIPYQNEQQEALSYILNACVTKTKDFSKKIQRKYSHVLFSHKSTIKIFLHLPSSVEERERSEISSHKKTHECPVCVYFLPNCETQTSCCCFQRGLAPAKDLFRTS